MRKKYKYWGCTKNREPE